MEKLQLQLSELVATIESGDYVPVYGPENKQKSPNQIRAAIRKYLAENTITQTEFINRIKVNSNSYGKFMNQKYKNEWSAVENGTYLSAACYLAVEDLKKKIAALEEKKVSNKRSAEQVEEKTAGEVANDDVPPPKKKTKAEAEALLQEISAVDVPIDGPVYASCDEIRAALNKFFMSAGITETAWLRCIGAQSNSLNSFRKFKGEGAGASNQVYRKAWRFFEQKRILEQKPKSAKRLEHEATYGAAGFPLRHDNGMRWVFTG